jgi:hypothetical protein
LRLSRARGAKHNTGCRLRSVVSLLCPGVSLRSPGTRACAAAALERTVGRHLNSRCQTAQSSSFPRRVYAPGFVCPVRPGPARGFGVEAAVTSAAIPAAAIPLHPERGVDGAPTGALLSCVARARRDHHAPVRPGPLSALHRGDFRPGTRAGSSGSGTGSAQRPVRRRTKARRDGVPGPPRGAVRAAVAGRHSLLRLKDRLRTTPLMSQDMNLIARIRYVVNNVVAM